MNNSVATLLRIALWSLALAVGCAADALGDTAVIAAVSGSDRVVARTLDLRPPELPRLQAQSLPPVATVTDTDEAEAVTIAAAPLPLKERPDTHLPPAGIASLYWAARHSRQAWRVLAPIRLDKKR